MGERIKTGRLHLMTVARTCAYGDGYGLGTTRLSGAATPERGSLALASGEAGEHLVITAIEVVD